MPAHIDTEPLFIPPKPDEANPLKWCKRCEHFMPLKNFDALLTRAQMKARGYAGNVRLPYSASMCKECRPKGSALVKKTPTQLQHLAYSGEITQSVADDLIALKTEQRKKNHSAAARRRWVRTLFKPLMDAMQSDNLWVHRLRSTTQAFLEQENASATPDPAVIARHTAVLDFANRYHAVLRDIALNIKTHRAQLLALKKGEGYGQADNRPYRHISLYADVDGSALAELRQLWANILKRDGTHPRIKPLRKEPAVITGFEEL